ncbi:MULTISPECIES: ABC transporter substrate-binding protein [unclassified Halorhodospira]|uniref:ABC transporter substrate-binding protein n=1 Tax=unclassified Halorhodospira TaxID=2626748 RepID=UPI001EE7C157|nr:MULTISPECIES: extracellular solute-binding protein [unclassified Halorhodospira]MCG5540017.1 extracellular solute-binding protein [Halorhodospira sp. M39old]MCG5544825.1 extracellular solute-binding protein [Halorhodospira sp. M38]
MSRPQTSRHDAARIGLPNPGTRSAVLALIAGGILMTAGCSGDEDVPTGAIDADDVDAGQVELRDDVLTVYLHDHGDAIAERFTDDTGIPVQIVDMSGGEILARIEAERANPQWDVVYVQGHGSVNRLYQEGQLLDDGWQPDNAARYNDLGRQIYDQDPDAAWWPVTVNAPALLVYNPNCADTERVEELGWDALRDPAFEGKVGMPDPAISGPAYPYVSWFFEESMDDGYGFWEDVFDNGVRMYRSNSPVAEALAAGDICVAGLEEPNTYGEVEKDADIEIVYPAEGTPGAARATGISADTTVADDARAFIEWMLEADTQTYLTQIEHRNKYFVPLVEGADPNELLPPNEFLDRVTPYEFTDYEWAGDVENEIKQWFADQSGS